MGASMFPAHEGFTARIDYIGRGTGNRVASVTRESTASSTCWTEVAIACDVGGSILDGSNVAAAEQEQGVDTVVGGEEALRLAG